MATSQDVAQLAATASALVVPLLADMGDRSRCAC